MEVATATAATTTPNGPFIAAAASAAAIAPSIAAATTTMTATTTSTLPKTPPPETATTKTPSPPPLQIHQQHVRSPSPGNDEDCGGETHENMQLCRICISSHTDGAQMIPIFGEDSLWLKITTLADVKIEKGDTLPQQVCIICARNAITACLFKKKCEDADNFFRHQQQQLIRKIEHKSATSINGYGYEDECGIRQGGDGDVEANCRQHAAMHSSSDIEGDDDDAGHAVDDPNHHYRQRHRLQQPHHNQLHHHHRRQQQQQLVNGHANMHHVGGEVDLQHPHTLNMNGGDDDDGACDDDDGVAINEVVTADDDDDGVLKANNGNGTRMTLSPQQHHQHQLQQQQQQHHHHQPGPFDFNSISLMYEYMQQQQQQMLKSNGLAVAADDCHSVASGCDVGGGGGDGGCGPNGDGQGQGGMCLVDDDEPLPLIPEIELITPSDGVELNGVVGGLPHSTAHGYQCPHCFQLFEMKQLLKAHMQSVHGISGPVYECTNCKKTYFYKRFLEKHMRRGRCVKKRRNQTRPMQCSDCHVLFPTGHHLGWHKRTGCPSRAAKMPLQQLFKQNIVQYNNFPKRIGIRKPENAIYLHNRKLLMASNKRKGRTRIKLDARKIALAKQLILREATTTVIANELNISRTFAWRLRKSLVNGVSLHERVIEPSGEEGGSAAAAAAALASVKAATLEFTASEAEAEPDDLTSPPPSSLPASHHHIKTEQITVDTDNENDDQMLVNGHEVDEDNNNGPVRGGSNVLRHTDGRVMQLQPNGGEHDETDDEQTMYMKQQQQRQQQLEMQQQHERLRRQQLLQNMALRAHREMRNHDEPQELTVHKGSSAAGVLGRENGLKAGGGPAGGMMNPYGGAGIAAVPVMHSLPVNLSIRSIASMQNKSETPSNTTPTGKKPRKPNVFIDDEKYAIAKVLVAQNSSTMEIARALNVSQMTAWKVRDAIVKGVPLSYRNKRSESRPRTTTSTATTDNATESSSPPSLSGDQQMPAQQQQHHQQQQQYQQQLQLQQLQQQQQAHELRLLQLQKHQQQLQQQQQQVHLQQQPQEAHDLPTAAHLQMQLQLHAAAVPTATTPLAAAATAASTSATSSMNRATKATSANGNPRRRLKAAEREKRDKEITRAILDLIKEDSNIQYWKVSARLAEQGFPISPSSVCQKLKSMGIHRRWKPGDKPPMLDMEQLKVIGAAAAVAAAAAAAANSAASSSADESYEHHGRQRQHHLPQHQPQHQQQLHLNAQQRFDMGGAHFLSAFTR